MFSIDCFGRAVGEAVAIQVFGNETLDVACVSWHLLLSSLFIWTTDPVFSKPTAIAKNNFVILHFMWSISVESLSFFVELVHSGQQF